MNATLILADLQKQLYLIFTKHTETFITDISQEASFEFAIVQKCVFTEPTPSPRSGVSKRNTMRATDLRHVCHLKFSSSHIENKTERKRVKYILVMYFI